MFIAAFFTITTAWKKPRCPSVDEWVKQLWDVYTVDHKKRKFLFFARVWMNLENIMLSEISQSEKEKEHISLICGI